MKLLFCTALIGFAAANPLPANMETQAVNAAAEVAEDLGIEAVNLVNGLINAIDEVSAEVVDSAVAAVDLDMSENDVSENQNQVDQDIEAALLAEAFVEEMSYDGDDCYDSVDEEPVVDAEDPVDEDFVDEVIEIIVPVTKAAEVVEVVEVLPEEPKYYESVEVVEEYPEYPEEPPCYDENGNLIDENELEEQVEPEFNPLN